MRCLAFALLTVLVGAAAADPPRPTARPTCDEVACLADPDLACCRRPKRRPALPADHRTSSEIVAVMRQFDGGVRTCLAGHKGTVKLTVSVVPSGAVKEVIVPGATDDEAACVELAMSQVRFRAVESQKLLRFRYPVKLAVPTKVVPGDPRDVDRSAP